MPTFIIRKFVEAKSISEALKKEKRVEASEIYKDEEKVPDVGFRDTNPS